MIRQPNQLHTKFMDISAMNFADGHDSSSRKQMFTSHLGQMLVIGGSTERRIQTGVEREIGKYTFNVKMPVDAIVIKVIDRYRKTIGLDSINHNPQSIILFEDVETKEIGVLTLNEHCSLHQKFGFKYNQLVSVRRGDAIKKGTVLLESPSINKSGGYQYGIEANMAFMTHPAVAEDGILVSTALLEKLNYKTFETRVVEFGRNRYPLNLYGSPDNYKSFPDIGDYVRDDGMIMALREHSEELNIVEQNIYDLCRVDFSYDKPIYADGKGGRVIDIRVHHDNKEQNPDTPFGMEVQFVKYDNARRIFYGEILTEYNRLKRERGEDLRISKELHRLVVEAYSVVGEHENRISMLYKENPLDDWRIEFVIEYDNYANIGSKLSGTHGDK